MKIIVGKNMLCLLNKRLIKDWKKYCNHTDGRCSSSNWILDEIIFGHWNTKKLFEICVCVFIF
jgi:hypothetical protein